MVQLLVRTGGIFAEPVSPLPPVVGAETLFNHLADAGNVGTGETDLFTATIPAGILINDGDRIEAQYTGIFVSSATATRRLRAYFGGTVIYDSGDLTLSLSADWGMELSVFRINSTTARCITRVNQTSASTGVFADYTEVTGLSFGTTKIIKITGQAGGAGAATNDIVARAGTVIRWITPAGQTGPLLAATLAKFT